GSLLERPAHLSITETSLAPALTRLADAAGVPVAFSPSMLPGGFTVSCACDTVTVAEALDTILDGTGIGYREAAGYVIIVSSRGPTSEARPVSGPVPLAAPRTPLAASARLANPAIRVD